MEINCYIVKYQEMEGDNYCGGFVERIEIVKDLKELRGYRDITVFPATISDVSIDTDYIKDILVNEELITKEKDRKRKIERLKSKLKELEEK